MWSAFDQPYFTKHFHLTSSIILRYCKGHIWIEPQTLENWKEAFYKKLVLHLLCMIAISEIKSKHLGGMIISSNMAGLAVHIWFNPCIIMASEAEKSFGSETRTSILNWQIHIWGILTILKWHHEMRQRDTRRLLASGWHKVSVIGSHSLDPNLKCTLDVD